MTHNRSTHMLRILLILSGLLVGLRASTAFAQIYLIPESGTVGSGCSFITGDMNFDCIPLYLSYIIKFFFGLAGGFALTEIIRGGYEFALSSIQATQINKETAKGRIGTALLGLAVTTFAYLIVNTIVSGLFHGT